MAIQAIVPAAIATESKMPLIELSVKPRLCVLLNGEKVCRDELAITWRSGARVSICLHQSDEDKALKCWQDAYSGEHKVDISIDRDIAFQLKEVVSQALIVSESFEVVQDNTKYRRRRRNAWSFF